MPKLILIMLAFFLILVPVPGISRHEDFLLYVSIAALELFAVVLFFKRISLPVYLIIPMSIFSGLALVSASHMVLRYSDYQMHRRYIALSINGVFSLIFCLFALSYWR